MDVHPVPGNVPGTSLRLDLSDRKPMMTAMAPGFGGHSTVLLAPGWLLPLAAWFAGEAQPVYVPDGQSTDGYGCPLDVRSDNDALVWNTHTWARLDCLTPYGSARVRIGPRGRQDTCTAVMLSPEARQDAATWLRRVAAQNWAAPAA